MNENEIPTTITATRKIDQLVLNERNPRIVKEEDFARLVEQIKRLGLYKPVVIDKNNKVLGGNMRVKALKDLGLTDVWVSVVDTKGDPTLELEYIMSDNDEIGTNDPDKLAPLITEAVGFPLELYKVQTFEPISLSKFLDQTSGNGDEDEAKDNDVTGELVTCPRCKLQFKKDDTSYNGGNTDNSKEENQS
jgi:hypothetical protein